MYGLKTYTQHRFLVLTEAWNDSLESSRTATCEQNIVVTHNQMAPLEQQLQMVTRVSSCVVRCRLWQGILEQGGIVKLIRVPAGQRLSNARLKSKGDIASKMSVLLGLCLCHAIQVLLSTSKDQCLVS